MTLERARLQLARKQASARAEIARLDSQDRKSKVEVGPGGCCEEHVIHAHFQQPSSLESDGTL